MSILRRIVEDMNHVEAALVPAHNSGYVALSLRQFDPSLFTNIAWGSPPVASVPRAQLARLGWTFRELPTLPDVDEPQDLGTLPADWIGNSDARK